MAGGPTNVTMDRVLDRAFYSPQSPACFSGINAVYKEAKRSLPTIKVSDVREYLHRQNCYTLHKPVRRRFPKNRIIPIGLDSDWQSDLISLEGLKRYNKGHTFVLTVIDVFSKHCWARPLKNKESKTVRDAFESILKESKRKPWRLMTDRGKEYMGKPFQSFMDEQDILHFTSKTQTKAANCERFNRTLKTRIWKYFTKEKTFYYLEILPKIVSAINHSENRMTKMRPVDVTYKNERELWSKMYDDIKLKPIKFQYKIGDHVRVSKTKQVFDKGYIANFSPDVYVIVERLPRQPPVYKLKDINGDMLDGVFYEKEMVKAVAAPENPQKRIKRPKKQWK